VVEFNGSGGSGGSLSGGSLSDLDMLFWIKALVILLTSKNSLVISYKSELSSLILHF